MPGLPSQSAVCIKKYMAVLLMSRLRGFMYMYRIKEQGRGENTIRLP